MKLIFLGTPSFAAISLKTLIESSHEVLAVITQADRASGRGLKNIISPVKKTAQDFGIKIYQPTRINTKESIEFILSHKPDILVLVAYGKILKEEVLNICSYPPINLHPSLLPDLRGAAPIQWALIRGYKESGLSTQFIAKELDAGDILLQEKLSIGEEEDFLALQKRMEPLGAKLLLRTLDKLEEGSLESYSQDSSLVSYAPPLEKSLSPIPWEEEREKVHNRIRGLCYWPGAVTYLASQRIKILKTRIPRELDGLFIKKEVGSFLSHGGKLFVQCKDAYLELLFLQPAGSRILSPEEFINGTKGRGVAVQEWRFFSRV